MTAINPLDFFEIEKSYEEIINHFSYIRNLKKIRYLNEKFQFLNLSYERQDSIIKYERNIVTELDSVQVEYYYSMNSFINKEKMHTVSNKFNISLRDLFIKYYETDSLYKQEYDI